MKETEGETERGREGDREGEGGRKKIIISHEPPEGAKIQAPIVNLGIERDLNEVLDGVTDLAAHVDLLQRQHCSIQACCQLRADF